MILAIDSSSLVASIALADNDTIIAEYTINLKKTHSQTLLPMINEIFNITGIDKKELKAVAVTGGPGSFTGLRIGVATAKGIALALNIPIINIPTIKAMAYNYNHCNKLLCPIMDARRNQVYTGIYRCTEEELEEILPACAISVEELMAKIDELGEEVIFIGDGIPVQKETLDDKLSTRHFYALQHMGRQRACSIASLAWKEYEKNNFVDSDKFAPEYFRMSQAERERFENDS